MRFKPALLSGPKGFHFVGSIPVSVAYVDADGNPATSEIVERQHMLPSDRRSIKTRVFETEELAWAAYNEAMEKLNNEETKQ